jgi:hypothetical protein
MRKTIRLGCVVLILVAVASSDVRGAGVGESKSFRGPVGLQLYSLRDQFKDRGVAPMLDQVAQWGFKYVFFQMDVLWTVFPGQDPAKLLEKYPDRWLLLHLKDLKKGVETGSLAGHTELTNDVTLGTGQVAWPALLRATQKVGVKYYFIEDESPTVMDQIPQSLKFLEQLKF